MAKLRAVLIDLSGTLHVEDNVIPGAIQAVKRLRKHVEFVKFVTNTSKESRQSLYNRLNKIGFDITIEELYTSLTAARSYVELNDLRPMLFLDKAAVADFEVVIGLSPSEFYYDKLNEAFRLLMNDQQSQLVAINKSRYYKRGDGLALGSGTFVQGLEYSTGKTAHVVGKPSLSFFHSAVHNLSSDLCHHDAVMIGDDCRDDVQGAVEAGLHGILVKTGKYREGDEANCSGDLYLGVVNSIVQAVELIIEHNAKLE